MSLNNFNNLNTQNILYLNSVIHPEKDKSYEYLKNYFEVKNIANLKNKANELELTKSEKIYHDLIINPTENNTTRIKAWIEYFNWVRKVFGSNDIRAFMVLENFTKTSYNDKENSNEPDYCKNWALYMEKCSDWEEVLKYMRRMDICTKNFFFYYAIAISYEKEHNFTCANLAFLEGLDKKVNDQDLLQLEYKKFEERMEGRIAREINTSQYSSQFIHDFIEKELRRKNADAFNENNKRLRNYPNEHLNNYPNKKMKMECDDILHNESSLNSVQYGHVPIFIDEPFRKNIITNGTKLVEKHNIMMKFLTENDIQIKMYVDQFNRNLYEDKKKRPVSWINGLRMLPDKISNINEDVITKNLVNNIQDMAKNQPNNRNKIPNKEENKVDEIMEKLIRDVNKKNDEQSIKNNQVQTNVPVNSNNFIKNVKNPTVHNRKIDSKVPTDLIQPDLKKNEIIETKDGKKYRIVKVESSKKETESNIDYNVLYDKELNKKISINDKLCKIYLDKLKVQAEAERNKLNKLKRKTIIYKLDSDGEVCMSSDEEVDKVKEDFKLNNNKIDRKEYIVSSNTNMNMFNVSTKNLNLFENYLSPEEINEKIKEVTNMYSRGMITIETRDLLYNHLEEKIIQMEKLEKEKKATNSSSINSFKQLITVNDNPQIVNPFLVNKKDKMIKDIFSSMESIEIEPKKTVIKYNNLTKGIFTNNIIHGTHPPLLELPNNGILKKNFEDTPFSNVSRSLDFTNIKILESNSKDVSHKSKLPLTSIFSDNNLQATKNPFYNEKKGDNTSVSFDSNHSHLFQQIDNSVIREEEGYESLTPRKEESHNVLKTFNIKDTPQLLHKKSHVDHEKESSLDNKKTFRSNLFNTKFDYNDFRETNQNNDIRTKNAFTDFNSINNKLAKELEGKETNHIKQEKLSKLFGDVFGDAEISMPFGLSSVTGKTSEKTYLSEDSFLFKR